MKIRRFGITATAATTAAGVLLTGGATHAQQASGSIASLDEVVVTATKREEKLHDVAMSITAVGGEDLLRRSENSLADFAAQVPGLALVGVDSGVTRVILRGQNVGSVGATIATTVDDIPFFMSGAQSDGAFFSANIDTFDLKRVEVLRGPQGTLYGAAAEGGLIKYVTNPPNPSRFEAQAVLGGVRVGDDSEPFGKAMVNIPVLDNTGALRISGSKEGIPGWIGNPLANQADVNHGTKHSVRASLLLKPVDALSLRFTVFNQNTSTRGSPSVEVVGAAATPMTPPANQFDRVDGFTNAAAWPHIADNQLEYYALSGEYSFPAATLQSATSYGEMTYRFQSSLQDSNLAPGFTYGDLLASIYAQIDPTRLDPVTGPKPVILAGHQTDFVKKFNQELRLSSKPGSTLFGLGLDWQLGGFFTREITGLIQPFDVRDLAPPNAVVAPPVGGAEIPGYYKETAFFGDTTLHFTPTFDIELGARHTSTKQHSQVILQCCILFGGGTTYPAIYADEDSNTWSAAPRWHITDDTLIYGRYATGFRPGGPNLPTPTLPNPPSFLSDRTKNYEVGVRTDLFGKRFSIDVALFSIDWTDVQILGIVQTSTGPVGINGNSGSAKSKGVEWTFSWRPMDNLSIQWLGAYTDAKLTTSAPGLGAAKDDKLPYVPDVSTTLNVDYRWSAFADYTAFAGMSVSHTGSRYTAFSPSTGVVEPHVKLPTYNTVKVQLGIDNGHYSAELYAANLTNQLGIEDYSNQGGYHQTGQATFIQPRTIGVQLGAKF